MVESPEPWSDLAIDIAVSRYFRKAGVPPQGYETSIRQLIERVISGFRKMAANTPKLFTADCTIDDFATNLKNAMLSQEAAFNSPVWFNLGLYESYGISASGENFRYDPKTKKTELVANLYAYPQTSACFIQSLDDDLLSIFDLAKKEAKVFKFGSGTGTNFSKLRASGEPLENGGRSSGVMSFLEVLDKGAGVVKSGGMARRAAKMVCLDVDHPEIETFISWKGHEEKKAKALIASGFSSGMTGEAYRTVSGQNSNNSVRITDAFMNALEKNESWHLLARTDKKIIKTLPARDIWREIAQMAWECGDPGLQFHDTIQAWHTCPEAGAINASNPCSEFMFVDDSACNLASINLLKFLDKDGNFCLEDFISLATNLITGQDLLVSNSSYPTKEVAKNSYDLRPLGIGFANLGAFLMSKGLPYDSEEGRGWAAGIAALLTGVSYKQSIVLARELGPFDRYEESKSSMLKVIEKHRAALARINKKYIPDEFLARLEIIWDRVVKDARLHGFRNSQVSAIAPTGTIGLIMDCSTMGAEPEYALVKRKFLVEGRDVRIVNSSVARGLKTLGYKDSAIEKTLRNLEFGKSLSECGTVSAEHMNVFDCAVGPRPISWQAQLEMVASMQPYISGSISKTLNLPESTTVNQIENVFAEAWKLGLKSLAVYRDQSKAFQPLQTI